MTWKSDNGVTKFQFGGIIEVYKIYEVQKVDREYFPIKLNIRGTQKKYRQRKYFT